MANRTRHAAPCAALLALAALLAAAGGAAAAGKKEEKPPREVLFLRHGKTMVARVLALAGGKLVLSWQDGRRLETALEELAPAQAYHLRRRLGDRTTVKALHDLAGFCAAQGLAAYARREYEAVREAFPHLADVVAIWLESVPAGPAQKLYAEAWDAVERKDFRSARERLRRLVREHPDHDLAGRARAHLPAVARRVHLDPFLFETMPAQTQQLVLYVEDRLEEADALLGRAGAQGGEEDRAALLEPLIKAEHDLVLGRRIYKTAGNTAATRRARLFLRDRRRALERKLLAVVAASADVLLGLGRLAEAREKVVAGLALDRSDERLRALARRINERLEKR